MGPSAAVDYTATGRRPSQGPDCDRIDVSCEPQRRFTGSLGTQSSKQLRCQLQVPRDGVNRTAKRWHSVPPHR